MTLLSNELIYDSSSAKKRKKKSVWQFSSAENKTLNVNNLEKMLNFDIIHDHLI